MYIIGLTGGIGSGESEAAKLFSKLGVPIVDVDKISHDLTFEGQPILKEIAKAFGHEVLINDRTLNRDQLRSIIFADESARKKLEAILHPAIYNKAIEELQKNTSALYQILVIPLLFESDRYLKIINRSLVIDSDPEMQISRASSRDHHSREDIQKIINAQMPREQRNLLADDIILNDGSIEALDQKIAQLHEKYVNTCVFKKSIS